MVADATSRESVAAFFDRYRAAFEALDGDAVASLWHLPCGIADARNGQGRLTWWTDPSAVRDNMHALCEAYRRAGCARVTFELRALSPMGDCHAHADVAWQLRRADGSLLQAFRTGYHLMRTGGDWRVLLATAHEEDLAAMRGVR